MNRFFASRIRRWFSNKECEMQVSANLREAVGRYEAAFSCHKQQTFEDAKFTAVDFETSGLDAEQHQIISMGIVAIEKGAIPLSRCHHWLVNSDVQLENENVAIHGITDDRVSTGSSAEETLIRYLELTAGKIIVAHHHLIERRFIKQLTLRLLGRTIPLAFVDTLAFERRRMERREQPLAKEQLRLFNVRKKYGLPAYHAHSALEDSIATAELFLAQVASMNMAPTKMRLKDYGCKIYR